MHQFDLSLEINLGVSFKCKLRISHHRMKQVLNKFRIKWCRLSYFSLPAKLLLIQSGILAPSGQFDNTEIRTVSGDNLGILFHISPQKHMLWVLIRIASKSVPITYVFMENERNISFKYHQIPSLSVPLHFSSHNSCLSHSIPLISPEILANETKSMSRFTEPMSVNTLKQALRI